LFDLTIDANALRGITDDLASGELYFDAASDPEGGEALIFGDGKFLTYQPDPDFEGSDFIQVSFSEFGAQGTQQFSTTLEILVEAVDDRFMAVTDGPFDVESGVATTLDAAALLANDTGGNGGELAIESVQTARPFDFEELFVTPSGDVRFALSETFVGTTRFNYKLAESDGAAATAEVILRTSTTVAPTPPGNDAPVAVNEDPVFLEPGVALTLDAADLFRNDADVDGDKLTLIFVNSDAPADFAELALDPTGGIRLQLADDFNGDTASFSYTAINSFGAPTFGEVTLITSAPGMPPEPLNEAPVAADDGPIFVVSGAEKTLFAAALLANDVDGDGDALTIVDVTAVDPFDIDSLVLEPSGDVRVDLLDDFSGATALSYTVADPSGAEASATVTLETLSAGPANNVPIAGNDGPIAVRVGTATTMDAALLLANDADVDGDAVQILDVATAEPFVFTNLSLNEEGNVELELLEGFSGETTFTYTIADPTGAEASAEVVVETKPSEPALEPMLAYNIGSDTPYTAGDGTVFAADDLGVGERDSSASSIAETDDDPLYQSGAYGPSGLAYDFVLENGAYQVTLHFAEIWPSAFIAGTRVFDVEVEGVLVEEALDVAATAGPRTAYQTQYVANVEDEQLDVDLIDVIENPILSGIEIERISEMLEDSDAGALNQGMFAPDTDIDAFL